MNTSQLAGILRHILTTVGGAGFAVSDDDLVKLCSALAALAGVLWSIYTKRSSRTAAGAPEIPVAILTACAVLLGLTACGTTGGGSGPTLAEVVTPARVQAVVTWGAYEYARNADTPTRAAIRQALPGLKRLAESPRIDGVTLAAALREAGIGYLSTPEGGLALAAGITFVDAFHAQTDIITEDPYVRAVLAGVVAGADLAFADLRGVRAPVNDANHAITRARLRHDAEAAR